MKMPTVLFALLLVLLTFGYARAGSECGCRNLGPVVIDGSVPLQDHDAQVFLIACPGYGATCYKQVRFNPKNSSCSSCESQRTRNPEGYIVCRERYECETNRTAQEIGPMSCVQSGWRD